MLELEGAAELALPLLKQSWLVVALDQHDFIETQLEYAQANDVFPLFLPIRYAPDAEVSVGKGDRSTAAVTAEQTKLLERLLAEAQLENAHLRAQVNEATSAGGPAEDSPRMIPPETRAADASTLEAQSLFDIEPALDPQNSDPGDLHELEQAKPPILLIVLGVLVATAATLYLAFAPEPPLTPEEQAEVAYQQALATEQRAFRVAEHVTYRARGWASDAQRRQRSLGTTCERLVREGRQELAEEICAQAHAADSAHAGTFAQLLMGKQALVEAETIVRLRLAEDPDDASAWTVLADLARRQGDGALERRAIEALIRIETARDPITPLRDRLQELDDALE